MADTHRLVLVRHAKAAGDSPTGSDRGRPLTDKGRTDADRVGAWLADRVAGVDAIWTSSATRARETAEGLAGHLPDAPAPDLRDDLYDAGAGDLLDALGQAGDDVRVLVVVGHNPTIEAAHATLTGDHRGFRPGAAAVVELPSWSAADDGAGRTLDFWSP